MRISELSKRSGFSEMTDIRNKLQEVVERSDAGNCPLDKVLQQL